MTGKRRTTRSILPLFLVALGCESGRAPNAERQPTPTEERKPPAGPRFVRGPTGGNPIEPFIAARVTETMREGRRALVYVGATWCEPCQYFHEAVEAGRLDRLLSGVDLVEFDLDADRDALGRAGCVSRLIPLFAVPDAAGKCTSARLSGSVKGPRAVDDNLVPRLGKLLAGETVD